ncbi:methyltransferase domain-containing protein [Bradyrhizobium sp. U87765 SZCCT0131]|uniref:class I SAM-dependent methyltransferase n=1 Tax=unclassified Bradyrhizobium TaxID=2631580 RepID=UPI001BA8823C|nr:MULTISPECIES: methyltransferase domain-containing protein [unclassified Bradyrhizobium]MBR1219995.1 methyltransferase domain-containing protein [Bradyrhizobium sp. U87765 SZCCT0131]MBR1263549.1 methyltransferase domain-containing protein [Bradyrhizobium sp. U87765 SZCCT0134]MBR1309118.1 methyltransferase domain-containing protein [Bradyrhizobium sp. U87765 SZCCT0110]MBR1323881.1 methyltransferase domain-containing protein [Bradyrhizobium sp. U87765 SZCCT0109]MBR1349433.1 methyltransferase d
MAAVSYDRQTINSPNPLARYAHRSRVARSVALVEQHLPLNGNVVDFGAGTGLLLSSLGERRPDVGLFAIEPYMPPARDPRLHYLHDFAALAVRPDVVSAFEVCEHLSDSETALFLANAWDALKQEGHLIISVPIMVGGALLLKELNRAVLFRRASDYSASELMAGTLGRTVPRPADRGPTHKGFDFRWLRDQLRQRFVVEEQILSPLPLPWWANSQIFFVCRKT